MPQGKVAATPDDGLTTRARRNRPLLVVHAGEMKGKSTAAFGMAMRAWNQGWSVAVYQFVKSAKWRVGEENALTALGRLHEQTGEGGPVAWHKMGSGWSWSRRAARTGGWPSSCSCRRTPSTPTCAAPSSSSASVPGWSSRAS